MDLYIPVYDHGWKIRTIDSATCRKLPHGSIVSRGIVYNNNFYTTEKAARDYINKNYHKCKQYRYIF